MPFRLSIEDGRFVQSMRVPRGRLTVGRARSNRLRLIARGVSRRHATLREVGGMVEIVDLGSKNGVVVAGSRVDRAMLAPGETAVLGNAKLTIDEVITPKGAPPPIDSEPVLADFPGLDDDEPDTMTVEAPPVEEPAKRHRVTVPPGPDVPAAPAATTAGRKAWARPASAPENRGPAAPSTSQHPAKSPTRPPPVAPVPVLRSDRQDFDEMVWGALRASPWYLISAVFHAAVLAGLMFWLGLNVTPPKPEPIHATVALNEGPEAAGLDDVIQPIDTDMPEDLERLVPDEYDDPATSFPTETLARDEDEQPEPVPDPGGGIVGADRIGETAIGIVPSGRFGPNLGSTFGKDDADRANVSAARALRADPFSRAILKGLRMRTTRDHIRVIGGEYDQCEKVLENLELPYDVMLPEELDLAPPNRQVKAVFYNCTPKPLTQKALDNLERYVREGGYLFTTDWGIEYVIERAFGRYCGSLRHRGRVIMTGDETIGFSAATDHPLLRGVPTSGSTSRWWLEKSSILIAINAPSEVDVLIRSEELRGRYGSGDVAVTFRHGRGRVVHVLGHFFQQEGNIRGAYAMQRLLMNFLYHSIRKR